MEDLVAHILQEVQADDYCIYFSDHREATFRADLYPAYKQNRTQPKPKHYQALKDFLLEKYECKQEVGQEADDGMGIAQTEDTVICSIDKDMMQVPGHHFNFVKWTKHFITEEEGTLFFYKQLLIGDTVDNIKGVTGIGKGKAGKLLDPLLGESEEVLFNRTRETYIDWLKKEWADQEWGEFQEKQVDNIMLLNGRLLKIRTEENELWEIPTSTHQEMEHP
jgi:5'-3' exonuclease